MPAIRRFTRTARMLLLAAPFVGACRPVAEVTRSQPEANRVNLAEKPLFQFSEDELDRYLHQVRDAHPNLTERIVALGRQNLTQPYEIYLLGEFPYETFDPDPIYCLRKSDCLTFCEHMYAMGMATDWWTFLRNLQRLRYKDGVVGMVTRNHYTVPDWDPNNGYLFRDLTTELGGGKASIPLTQTCRRDHFFAKFGIHTTFGPEPVVDAYIPKENVPAILHELHNADFLNIIRGDKDTQWAGHTGMIAIADDGTVDFLHSTRPDVHEQPLVGYLMSSDKNLGIKVLRLRPDAEKLMREAVAHTPDATPISEASLNQALADLYDKAPPTAKPIRRAWREAMRFQAYRLDQDAPNPALQTALEKLDQRLGAAMGIPDDDRAVGLLDLTDLRLAMVRPDAMFYAASVPKIGILLAYFDAHPEAAFQLDPQVQRELGRMIKRSDNALAFKYGEQLGIERIQKVLQSKRYRLYDKKRGGGLWYGKHYGKPSPRIGDPQFDYSHGATVRQVLRFYLMLEQGRLVSGSASTKMREIFASPELEHLDSKFVAGLAGRDVSLIRKSGTWKDWYLDTARIEHGSRVYLLAGMVHHPRGAEFLSALAAGVDDLLCGPVTEKPWVHARVTQADGVLLPCPLGSIAVSRATYESPVVRAPIPFNELLLSWNVAAPPNVSYCVEARVGRGEDDSWSPYLYFGDWNASLPFRDRVLACAEGKIDVDYFVSDQRYDRAQIRLRAKSGALEDGSAAAQVYLRIERLDLNFTDTTGLPTAWPQPKPTTPTPREAWTRRLPVPYRSQRAEEADIAGRICSPTSLSMVLAYRGVNRPTRQVADRAFDSTWDIYGNWPRSVQTAFSFGVPGYLERISDWATVERYIADGQPLIISIKANPGELASAPYDATDGHLLVVTGFDDEGNVLVNDPAATDQDQGERVYARRDLETVWMRARGGTAYVLLSPEEAPSPAAVASAEEPFVEIARADPRILIDLRYTTPNNFTHQSLYPADFVCRLRASVAQRLKRVQDRLVRRGLGLKVFDGYRPLSVQREMWEVLPDSRYVADPAKGSRHNRGAAVDVTLVDVAGRQLEMPTPFDDFTEAAHRDYDGGTAVSRKNRKLLEEVMTAEGFTGLPTEWWHFDAPNWQLYPIPQEWACPSTVGKKGR